MTAVACPSRRLSKDSASGRREVSRGSSKMCASSSAPVRGSEGGGDSVTSSCSWATSSASSTSSDGGGRGDAFSSLKTAPWLAYKNFVKVMSGKEREREERVRQKIKKKEREAKKLKRSRCTKKKKKTRKEGQSRCLSEWPPSERGREAGHSLFAAHTQRAAMNGRENAATERAREGHPQGLAVPERSAQKPPHSSVLLTHLSFLRGRRRYYSSFLKLNEKRFALGPFFLCGSHIKQRLQNRMHDFIKKSRIRVFF